MTTTRATKRRLVVDCIVGVRPNFVKIAPIMRALGQRPHIATRLIHTGQHYDVAMNAVFFEELGIPAPDLNLEIASGSQAEQTGRMMIALEPVFLQQRPDIVVVVGDVNSTLAATLVAAKLGIPVAHVEAGLRSFDWAMPEEINRLVTDRLSSLLLASEQSGVDNLAKEGARPEQVILVGNVMIDTLLASVERAVDPRKTLAEHDVPAARADAAIRDGFGFVTLHRPSNVDDPVVLAGLLSALDTISQKLRLVIALHPRTRATIEKAGLGGRLASERIMLTPPLSYLRAVGLMRAAKLVMTDSGGVQEETTALGVPCLTVRENTERPITIDEGTNTLVGTDPAALIAAVEIVLSGGGKRGCRPELWDGKASVRIVDAIERFLDVR